MEVNTSVKRVLIYVAGSLGDTMVTLPCFHLIAKAYPNARRLLFTNIPVHAKAPAAAAVLGDSGLVDGYILYEARQRAALWRRYISVRRFKPEVVIELRGMHRPAADLQRDKLFFKLAGGKKFVGFPVTIESRRKLQSSPELYEHEAKRLARSIAVLGDVDVDDPANWDLLLSESEKQRAQIVLSPITGRARIVCGPGTKMQAKDWGQENWRMLIAKLARRFPDHALVMIGAKEDFEVSEYVRSGWGSASVNVCGSLTPRETAAVMAGSELFLGPDSGPMHLAASCSVPCAIAFSARDYPGAWYPAGAMHHVVYHAVECRYCRLETCIVKEKICMTSISVEEMYTAAMEAWGDGQRPITVQTVVP